MYIKKQEVRALSQDIRRAIDGEAVDVRDHKEGAWSILKNDIHTLINLKNEELDATAKEHALFMDFMEDVSHQLKTPLTSMMLMADLMATASPERQGDYVRNIKISLDRMEWLVDCLLKMAKLDAGAVSFDPKPYAVSALLEEAQLPLAVAWDIKAQQAVLKADAMVVCDKRWTVEALTNLLKNAGEVSPEGATLMVEGGDNPLYGWISVQDAGEGIARSAMPTLFKRFEGSHNPQGVGIGLPLALAIVRGQHGDIDVDGGGNGHGATFTMKFFK